MYTYLIRNAYIRNEEPLMVKLLGPYVSLEILSDVLYFIFYNLLIGYSEVTDS